jgi:hypothetical protein
MEKSETLAAYSLEHGLLAKTPVKVVDVGAREGEVGPLTPLYGLSEVIGFDFDAAECRRLNQSFQGRQHRYFPVALDASNRRRAFHIAHFPPSSGFYANRPAFWNRFTPIHMGHVRIVETIEVATQTLDRFFASQGEGAPDFLKLALLLEAFGFNDCAIELVQTLSRELAPLVEPGLAVDLLTPLRHGRKLPYDQYLASARQGDSAVPWDPEQPPHPVFRHAPALNTAFVDWIQDGILAPLIFPTKASGPQAPALTQARN